MALKKKLAIDVGAASRYSKRKLGRHTVSDEKRAGHYEDKYGNWVKDRRRESDRRKDTGAFAHEERRNTGRRKTDALLERDHREMIEDALKDFAAEHGGHL